MFFNCIKYIMFFGVSILLTSCITNRTTRYLQDIKGSYPPYDSTAYKITKNDEISMLVYTVILKQKNCFQKLVLIMFFSDGTIDLPFVDTLKNNRIKYRTGSIKN
jgi:hypothetical protein